MAGREEDEFDAFMRRHGVAPIAGQVGAGRGKPQAPAGQAKPPVATTTAATPIARAAAGEAAPATQVRGAVRDAVRDATLDVALDAARKQAEIAVAQAEAATAQAAQARRERDEAVARAVGLEAELAAVRVERQAFDKERRDAARRLSELGRSLGERERRLADADKRSVFEARGLAEGGERVAALACLLDANGPRTLDALCDPDPRPLAGLLDRLVRCCDEPGCQPPADTPRLRVAKADCEVCGGSDVRRAFVAFAAACRAAGLDRVTLVGGSPAYRETLRGLAREHGGGLVLQVVQHERPDEAKRAQAVRGLVVIWGATAVDHTTTGHYRSAGDVQIAVNHRGVAGMLGQVSERLAARRAT